MVFILTGPVHSGKTTVLKQAVERWISDGRRICGFLSEAVYEGNAPARYDLFDLKKQTRIPFITRKGAPGWPQCGPYFFIPEALDSAKSIIADARGYDLCVVDEVGPLELQGEGLWPSLEKAICDPGSRFLLVVRRSILEDILKALDELRHRGRASKGEGRGQTYTFDIITLKSQFGKNGAEDEEEAKGIVSPFSFIDLLTRKIFGQRGGLSEGQG